MAKTTTCQRCQHSFPANNGVATCPGCAVKKILEIFRGKASGGEIKTGGTGK